MRAQPRDHEIDVTHQSTRTQRGLEMGIFLLASAVGIYGIGKGLAGFYDRGQEVSLLWLAVTCLAFFVLFAQMGRVHDTWPRRPGKSVSHASITSVSSHDASSDRSESR